MAALDITLSLGLGERWEEARSQRAESKPTHCFKLYYRSWVPGSHLSLPLFSRYVPLG